MDWHISQTLALIRTSTIRHLRATLNDFQYEGNLPLPRQRIRVYGVLVERQAQHCGERIEKLTEPTYSMACVADRLVESANTSYQAKTDTMNDTAVENVVLRFLMEFISCEGEYGSKVLHRGLVEFIRAEGINVGEIREDYFGTLLHHLQVCEKKFRKTLNGEKQTVYWFRPERVRLVAENYRAKQKR